MYGKIFDSIFDSSIMEESIETRYIWNCMIALADSSGNVDMTLAALARRINVPLSTVSNAVHKLSQPDPSSRSPEEEGRRLVPIDVHREWGWHLVNRSKYSDIRSSGDRTTYWREQKRRKRAEKAAASMSTSGQSGQSTASTNIEVRGRGIKTKEAPYKSPAAPDPSRPGCPPGAAAPPRGATRGTEFAVWYGLYPRKVGRQAALGEWEKLARSGALPPLDELLGRLELHAASPRWQNGTIPDPRTYLHQRRWEDDPESLVAIGSNGNGKRPLTRHQEKRAAGYDPNAPPPKVSRVENVWLTMTEEERQAWGAMTDEERRQWNADHGHAH